jgi:hypothetical protein
MMMMTDYRHVVRTRKKPNIGCQRCINGKTGLILRGDIGGGKYREPGEMQSSRGARREYGTYENPRTPHTHLDTGVEKRMKSINLFLERWYGMVA